MSNSPPPNSSGSSSSQSPQTPKRIFISWLVIILGLITFVSCIAFLASIHYLPVVVGVVASAILGTLQTLLSYLQVHYSIPPNNPLGGYFTLKTVGTVKRRNILIFGSGVVIGAAAGIGLFSLFRSQEERSLPHANTSTTYAPPILRGHTDTITSVAWSPDGNYLASASYDQTIRIWGLSSKTQTIRAGLQGHTDVVSSVAWSPDGNKFVSGSWDKTLITWDFNMGSPSPIRTFRGHTAPINTIAWSPDGLSIASGSSKNEAVVKVWTAASGNLQFTTPPAKTSNGHLHNVDSVGWSSDSTTIASGAKNDSVYVWYITTHANTYIYLEQQDEINTLAWSPQTVTDDQYVASGSGYNSDNPADNANNPATDTSVRVWSPKRRQTKVTYSGHVKSVLALAWSPDGKYIASSGLDQTIHVWEAFTGKIFRIYQGHSEAVLSLTWSPDNKYIASGSADRTIRIWQVK